MIAAGAGAFFGSYFKKKGENLATHEDIDKLVDQVSAVTSATKEIEAKISSDVWDRQKRWELKRGVIVEAVRKMGDVENALSQLHSVYMADKVAGTERPQARADAYCKFNDTTNEFDRAALLVGMACTDELRQTLLTFGVSAREITQRVSQGEPEVFVAWAPEFVRNLQAATEALRGALHAPS